MRYFIDFLSTCFLALLVFAQFNVSANEVGQWRNKALRDGNAVYFPNLKFSAPAPEGGPDIEWNIDIRFWPNGSNIKNSDEKVGYTTDGYIVLVNALPVECTQGVTKDKPYAYENFWKCWQCPKGYNVLKPMGPASKLTCYYETKNARTWDDAGIYSAKLMQNLFSLREARCFLSGQECYIGTIGAAFGMRYGWRCGADYGGGTIGDDRWKTVMTCGRNGISPTDTICRGHDKDWYAENYDTSKKAPWSESCVNNAAAWHGAKYWRDLGQSDSNPYLAWQGAAVLLAELGIPAAPCINNISATCEGLPADQTGCRDAREITIGNSLEKEDGFDAYGLKGSINGDSITFDKKNNEPIVCFPCPADEFLLSAPGFADYIDNIKQTSETKFQALIEKGRNTNMTEYIKNNFEEIEGCLFIKSKEL